MDENVVSVKYIDETIRDYHGIPMAEVGIGDSVGGLHVEKISVDYPSIDRRPRLTFYHPGGTVTVLPDLNVISYISRVSSEEASTGKLFS